MVADRQLLQLGDDAVGAWAVRRKQQPVHPFGGVPGAAVPAHLHKPGPDPFRRRGDRDGMGRYGHGVAYQLIARHAAVAFGSGGPVGAAEPLQRQVTGNRARGGRGFQVACHLARLPSGRQCA